jgi:hypothetical protein
MYAACHANRARNCAGPPLGSERDWQTIPIALPLSSSRRACPPISDSVFRTLKASPKFPKILTPRSVLLLFCISTLVPCSPAPPSRSSEPCYFDVLVVASSTLPGISSSGQAVSRVSTTIATARPSSGAHRGQRERPPVVRQRLASPSSTCLVVACQPARGDWHSHPTTSLHAALAPSGARPYCHLALWRPLLHPSPSHLASCDHRDASHAVPPPTFDRVAPLFGSFTRELTIRLREHAHRLPLCRS